MKNRLSRLLAVATLSLGTASAFALDLPTTGTCGFTIGANFPFTGPFLGNLNGTQTVNHIGTINFATKTMKLVSVSQKVASETSTTENGITSISGRTYTNTEQVNSITFSSTPSSSVVGLHALALSSGDKMNLLPVNNGKTVLMQLVVPDDMGGRLGVCQF